MGKLKTASSKRIVPLNETAIQAIIELRNERYFGEDADLLGHTTSEITEMYYVKRNTDMLLGVTNGFEL